MPESFDFNPFDEATRRDPYATYARGRDLRVHSHDGFPAHSVFRHADTVALLKDWESWSNVFPMRQALPEREVAPSMLGTDPPEHERLRGLVNQAFTPRIVRQREARMVEITHALLDRALAAGHVDLVQALTYPLPVTIIAEIIGVPTEDGARFKSWSDALVANLGSGLLATPDPERMAQQIAIGDELRAYFRDLVAKRRSEPREDLLSGLIAAEHEGSQLSFEEMIQMLILILVAGNETTTTLIGNTIVTLLEHPDQLERLRAEPERVPSAIEEVLRFSSPIQVDPRCATRDQELCGVEIKKGEMVLAWLGAANRDADVFPEPERFDIARKENRHLSFGFGTHYCLGSNLARLEAQTALRVLLERTSSFRRTDDRPLPLHPRFVFRSYRELPVVLEGR